MRGRPCRGRVPGSRGCLVLWGFWNLSRELNIGGECGRKIGTELEMPDRGRPRAASLRGWGGWGGGRDRLEVPLSASSFPLRGAFSCFLSGNGGARRLLNGPSSGASLLAVPTCPCVEAPLPLNPVLCPQMLNILSPPRSPPQLGEALVPGSWAPCGSETNSEAPRPCEVARKSGHQPPEWRNFTELTPDRGCVQLLTQDRQLIH